MSVLAGIAAVVNGHTAVRNWNTTQSAALNAIYSSATDGAPMRLDGNKDWSGSFSQYVFQPAVVPGELFKFQGSIDGTQGVTSEASGAIVDSVTIAGDIEAGTAITCDVAFSGNGTLTKETAAISDATCPEPYSAIGSYITLENAGDLTGEESLTDVRNWSFTISRANKAYNSSDTAGQTHRLKGNLEATLSISLYESDLDNVILPNEEKIVRIYLADGTFWEFQWMKFSGDGGFQVDREGAALISYTLTGGFNGYTVISDTCTEGVITMPDESDLWPEA